MRCFSPLAGDEDTYTHNIVAIYQLSISLLLHTHRVPVPTLPLVSARRVALYDVTCRQIPNSHVWPIARCGLFFVSCGRQCGTGRHEAVVCHPAVRSPVAAPVRPRHAATRLVRSPRAQSLEPEGFGSPLQKGAGRRGCYGVSVSRDSPWASPTVSIKPE